MNLWSMRFSNESNQDVDESVVYSTLVARLKTTQGVRAFTEALPQNLSTENRSLIKTWLEKWSTAANVPMIMPDFRSIEITIEGNDSSANSEFLQAFRLGLNGVLEDYNANLGRFQEQLKKLEAVEIETTMALGKYSVQAAKLFEKHSGLTQAMNVQVIGLFSTSIPESLESAILLLLGPVPDADPLKRSILEMSKKSTRQLSIISHRILNAKKLFGVEDKDVVIPLLSSAEPFQNASSGSVKAPVGKNSLTKLPVAIVLGTLIGGIVGFLLAVTLHYIKKNRQRLNEVFNQPVR